MEYEADQRPYDGILNLHRGSLAAHYQYLTNFKAQDEPRGYDDRERSRSPRAGNGDMRTRSASPGGRDRMDTRLVLLAVTEFSLI